MCQILCFTVFLRVALKFGGGESSHPQTKFRGYGLTGRKDLFRLVPFSSFFLHSLFPGICSDLLRFLFRFVFSTQIRTNQGNPFC